MKFKYQGRIYNPVNIEKKLKKMGITLDDIEIIPSKVEEEKVENDNTIELHKFINSKTKKSIISIYDNLCHLKNIVDINDYEKI